MVNVGGRSKGCSTCRRRRIKCDEARPACSQCKRGGFQCSGPRRDIVIIEAKIPASRRSGTKLERALVDHSSGATNTSSQLFYSPSARPLQFALFLRYSRRRLARGSPVDNVLQKVEVGDSSYGDSTQCDRHVLHQLAQGFAAIIWGANHSDPAVAREGYAIYGLALRSLNRKLSSPRCYESENLLLSVALLALLESFVPTGPGNFIKHAIGFQRLLELRGPGYGSDIMYLHKNIQYMLLFASFRAQVGSILAAPNWRTFLRGQTAAEEIAEHDLREQLAICTILAAEHSRLVSRDAIDDEYTAPKLDGIMRAARTILNNLYAWKDRSDLSQLQYVEHPQAATVETAQASRPWPFSTPPFHFHSVQAAELFMLYNLTRIHLLQLLDENTTQERLAAAFEICQCLPYCLSHRTGSSSNSVPLIRWTIATAWKTLGGISSEEGQWIVHALSASGQRTTTMVLRFVDVDLL